MQIYNLFLIEISKLEKSKYISQNKKLANVEIYNKVTFNCTNLIK